MHVEHWQGAPSHGLQLPEEPSRLGHFEDDAELLHASGDVPQDVLGDVVVGRDGEHLDASVDQVRQPPERRLHEEVQVFAHSLELLQNPPSVALHPLAQQKSVRQAAPV